MENLCQLIAGIMVPMVIEKSWKMIGHGKGLATSQKLLGSWKSNGKLSILVCEYFKVYNMSPIAYSVNQFFCCCIKLGVVDCCIVR